MGQVRAFGLEQDFAAEAAVVTNREVGQCAWQHGRAHAPAIGEASHSAPSTPMAGARAPEAVHLEVPRRRRRRCRRRLCLASSYCGCAAPTAFSTGVGGGGGDVAAAAAAAGAGALVQPAGWRPQQGGALARLERCALRPHCACCWRAPPPGARAQGDPLISHDVRVQ
jgi:hypothetical protein